MNETIFGHRFNMNMDLNDFYTIETPPSSSTSKDSIDELVLNQQNKQRKQINKTNHSTDHEQKSKQISMNVQDESQVRNYLYEEMQTPLRRTLGNTKLKTRQDVRRFRKFLKRNYDLQSMALIDIDPDQLRNYLIHYLTSIRTRKGLKYDPETLRSYYLSIQRFLKDSNYPYCLRNSPQFAQCRDLIIQMRKEKHQTKLSSSNSTFSDISRVKTKTSTNKETRKKPLAEQNVFSSKSCPSMSNDECFSSNSNLIVNEDQKNSKSLNFPSNLATNSISTKDLLPCSSLPPRKRQQMKYFLESTNSNEFSSRQTNFAPTNPICNVENRAKSSMIISDDAYRILVDFTRLTSSFEQNSIEQFETILDQSNSCGNVQRLMLTNLCHQWTGDIRLIHSNLRKELNSFLPHILLMSILSSKNDH